MPSESEGRRLIVEQAKTWLGTPYHSNAAIRGAGIDCVRLIQRCYVDAGIMEEFEIPHYSPQWAIHQKLELALEGILKYSHEVEKGLPGDIALFKVGKCWGHASLVVEWPIIIHASGPWECRYEDVLKDITIRRMTPRFFSYW